MVRSLGYVSVAAAGTPVRATNNETDPAARIGAQAVLFQALPANAGPIYIGLAGMDKTTGVGVLAILPGPTDPATGPFPSFSPAQPLSAAAFNMADFYVDADNNDDGVVISYTQG